MRVLEVLTYYAPHWTGLTTHAVRVAEGLAARGHEVTVLTTRHTPDLAREELVRGVRVVRLTPIGRFSRGMIAPAFPVAAARLVASHDVVQMHTPLPEALLVALVARALGKPVVMTHHGDIVMPKGAANRLVERAAFGILLAAGSLAEAVTSYSDDYTAHSRLLTRLGKKVISVPPPVDIPPPDPDAARAWKKELGLEGKRLIGIAGRWVEEKGFDVLLEALPSIRAAVPGAHVVYAGEPSVYEDFYERCRPLLEREKAHVTLLGLVRDARKMADFYAMCDLFALPSRSDMMALVQVEAMLSGTPVVASDVPGARVVVRETGFGKLTPPGDAPALSRTIVEALLARDVLQPDPALVRRLFDAEATLDRYEAILSGTLAGPS
ncbi:MAG TPA: glycosyltransferase family 4 protein [Thermoanaerobaculia bacterium]|nr:glycosyltransferase family 4 protein [Thermoanaerobaculia bacterium]